MLQLLAQCITSGAVSDQHRSAHRLLKQQLGENGVLPPYHLRKGEHGKPFLMDCPDVHFNVSHCRSAVLSGLGSAEMGVDVEAMRPLRMRIAQRICTDSEQQEILQAENPALMLLRFWTLKESYVKALGIGISYPMQTAAFSLQGNIIKTNIKGYRFFQYILSEQLVFSACIAASESSCTFRMLDTEATPVVYQMAD